LTKYLVISGKKRRKRAETNKKRANRIPNRTPIEKRPEAANSRTQAGHWEADTAVSQKSKAALSVIIDRKHKITFIMKLARKTAKEMKQALTRKLIVLLPEFKRTSTYYNVLENVLHDEVNVVLGTKSYFFNTIQIVIIEKRFRKD
jgi:IS30 family transposase